jgi:eukaryotic-like serine/threonine-protein kinase
MSTITDSIGRVLARRYRIESALGSGTSASVFAAWDVTLQRRVAVKVLHPGLATDAAFLRRFRSEAQSAAALTHPHVLSVYDWGEDERGPFLVLEFLGGGSLRDLLDNGRRLSVAQSVAIGVQAADGLAYAHRRGFVHRDVKPANLVFDEEGRLCVADFGLARALAEAAMTEPAGTSVGTARYAAPEQALGRPVDGRADVYSLGLVLYESVTGVVPFTADTTVGTLMARVGAHIPGHDGLGPLADILDAAVAPEVDERLDAGELAVRLRELGTRLGEPDRLPLAGAGGRGVPQPGAVDRTEHGMTVAPTGAVPAGAVPAGAVPTGDGATASGTGRSDTTDALALATAVGTASDSTLHPPGDAGDADGTRRRRRWPWVVVAAIVIAGGLGAGGDYLLSRTTLVTPRHKLPVLTGMTPAQARLRVRRDHLRVRVERSRSSTTVPTGRIVRQIPGAGTSMTEGRTVSVVVSSGPPPVTVPSLAALTGGCPAVVSLLTAAHLHAACTTTTSLTAATGTVISWTPRTTAIEGSTVSVTVSSGPPSETIPSLTGATCTGAMTALTGVHLVGQCTNAYSSTVASGQVISWIPTGTAPAGSTIAISISEGPQPVTVPNVGGDTVAQAIAALEAVGLVPAADGPLVGHVFDSTPTAGTSVLPGTTVTLYSK